MLKRTAHQSGFTLLEVMVAIGIFAVLGAGAYQLLSSATLSHNKITAHSDDLSRLQRSVSLLRRDLLQVTPRAIRTEYQDREPALIGNSETLTLTRLGWNNPLAKKRSNSQRLSYHLGKDPSEKREGEHLIRSRWQVLDRSPDSEARQQLLIADVEQLEIRYLGNDEQWHSRWPVSTSELQEQSNSDRSLPVAIEVKYSTRAHGNLRHLIQVGELKSEAEK